MREQEIMYREMLEEAYEKDRRAAIKKQLEEERDSSGFIDTKVILVVSYFILAATTLIYIGVS